MKCLHISQNHATCRIINILYSESYLTSTEAGLRTNWEVPKGFSRCRPDDGRHLHMIDGYEFY